MSQFLHEDDNSNAKAIAILWVFAENSQGNKMNISGCMLCAI